MDFYYTIKISRVIYIGNQKSPLLNINVKSSIFIRIFFLILYDIFMIVKEQTINIFFSGPDAIEYFWINKVK